MIKGLYDNFKHWSEEGSVYILSDTHFDDEDCKLMDKNWITPAEQVDRINKLVKKNDTLILLGDVGNVDYIRQLKAGHKVLIAGNHDSGLSNYKKVTKSEIRPILELCSEVYYDDMMDNETKLFRQELVEKYPQWTVNNIYESWNPNDCQLSLLAVMDNGLFDEVYGGPLFISDKIILSHEPIDLPFALNIHGHKHDCAGFHYVNNQYNVCANCIDYIPVSLGKIIKDGVLRGVPSIHRATIDRATERKYNRFIEIS